jgi:hypothetical protein
MSDKRPAEGASTGPLRNTVEQLEVAARTLLENVEPPLLKLGLGINADAEVVCAECGGGFRADKDFVISHASRCPVGGQPFKNIDWQATARQYYDWLYAVWMAFLADEETHELQQVLRNLSATMQENERP